MGTITRSLSNNITTDGVILPAGITNSSVSAVTSFANASGGTLILLSTQTASNSATISFTTGLDSTYDAYEFHFIDVKCGTDNTQLTFNFSTDGGSNYNVAKTSTFYVTIHSENDAVALLEYSGGFDLAQGTGFQQITSEQGTDADQNSAGTMTIYNPSSTTYVKHWTSNCSGADTDDRNRNYYTAGYGNTTSAVNAIQFKFNSGNIADGIFKLYGVKKS